jgi:predicted aspartyl protease
MTRPLTSQQLSPTLKKRLHKTFLENERLYWQTREHLLHQYHGQWVAFVGGEVIASGDDLLNVTDRAGEQDAHAYITRVGQENRLVFAIRRSEFGYDTAYQPFALPQAEVIFSNYQGTGLQFYPDVVPDTGADISALPENDCDVIDLFGSPRLLSLTRGVMGTGAATLVYRGHAEIAGVRYRALIHPIPGGKERILGREVLNQLKVTFDGPRKKVVLD